MTQELQTLSGLVQMFLLDRAPILSGNLMREIAIAELVEVNDYEVTFCIQAPFYDMKKWKETGAIIHNHKNYNGITNYAMWLNDVGAFGTHNASMHWVNRTLNELTQLIPNAEVINKLELD